MNGVNKTLYIPLYGKSYVSKKGLFLDDKKAEEIWEKEGFALKGKSKSKWLAYYMGIRSAVFDRWLKDRIAEENDAVVIHLGCGLDSRVLRMGTERCPWYDVDFPSVIEERKKYYEETPAYRMIATDVRDGTWLTNIPQKNCAIIVMEGISMYLTAEELNQLMAMMEAHFEHISLLTDCYTVLAAKMSKYKNPVKDVGVNEVYGIDDPKLLQTEQFVFLKEHEMTPQTYINELNGFEKLIFKKLYAGNFAKKLYRLFEFKK